MRPCPNCTQTVEEHQGNGCVLAAFIQLLIYRGIKNIPELEDIHAECNIDALWYRLGPVLDDLEAGKFRE